MRGEDGDRQSEAGRDGGKHGVLDSALDLTHDRRSEHYGNEDCHAVNLKVEPERVPLVARFRVALPVANDGEADDLERPEDVKDRRMRRKPPARRMPRTRKSEGSVASKSTMPHDDRT